MSMFKQGLALVMMAILFAPAPLGAQTPDAAVPTAAADPAAGVAPAAAPVDPAAAAAPIDPAAAAAAAAAETEAFKKPFLDTLLFTNAEVALLRESSAGRATSSAILDAGKVELIPIDRKIKLYGIYYSAPNRWIVWMNGHKLVPGRVLPEIHEIRVNRDEVFLRWYDIGLNDIISITLRPNQIYDIVTGIVYNDTAGGRAGGAGQ